MPLTAYLPHVVYSMAVTSIAVHLLSQRRGAEERKLHLEARIGVLESIRNRLSDGEDVADDEIARLKRMASEGTENAAIVGVQPGRADKEDIGWKEVVLGRKTDAGRSEAEDLRLRKEWNDAIGKS